MFKIGQRVKHDNFEQCFYLEQEFSGFWDARDEDGCLQHFNEKELSPLYKPGDTVRIKSREELKENSPDEDEGWYDHAGVVTTLKENNPFSRWWFTGLHDWWTWGEDDFEWHSEEKPEEYCEPNSAAGVKLEVFTSMQAANVITADKLKIMREVARNRSEKLVAEVHQDKEPDNPFTAKILDGRRLVKIQTKDKRNLIPEWFRDKERDRAVLAEELKHKPYFRIKYRCMSGCGYEGTQTEVKDHMKQKHNETTPNLTSPVWDKFKVK